MDIDYKTIGKRIALRRRELGLKQSQVEEKAGIGYNYLSNIERGISIPSIEVIMKLAYALETTPDFFLVGTNICKENECDNMLMILQKLNSNQLLVSKNFLNWLIENKDSVI